MSSVAKQIGSEAALWDLWRVAETGEIDELERVLARAGDVNAHNKHGMTALMRAAHHGHTTVVRALLRHGADPNLTRNDRFTALALAAFFGHTDTVRTLIEHGAKTEVVTRCNTSAYMWANARTFSEAARCLKSYKPAAHKPAAHKPAAHKPAAHKPAAHKPAVHTPTAYTPTAYTSARATVPAATTAPLVVKTLKDPPEIWDLVHEEPQNFNARSAFAARLSSIRTSVAFRIAAVVLVSATCVVGALVLKGSQARNLPEAAPAAPQVAPPLLETVVKTEPETPAPAPAPVEIAEPPVTLPPVASVKPNAPRRMYSFTRQSAPRAIANDTGADVQIVETKESPVAPPVVSTPQIVASKPNKPTNNPQPVAPARSAAPKAKVIQWP